MLNPGSEFGVSLAEAHKHYCRPDIWERYVSAGGAARWDIRHTRFRVGGLTPREEERRTAVDAYRAAEAEVKKDINMKLADSRLVAMGFLVGHSGRDPNAGRRRIPEDVLKSRGCKIEWSKGKISGNGLTFVDVRIGTAYEAPGAAEALVRCTLSECFQRVVVDDWLRREMEEPVFRRFPDWKFPPDQFHFLASDRWPVKFEHWSNAAYSVSRFKEMIIVVGEPSPIAPKEVVAVRERIEAQVRRLITWLRNGTLVAEGTKEPPDDDLTRIRISPNWWAREGVEMDTSKSTLLIGPPPHFTLKFSDIRMVTPEGAVQKASRTRWESESSRPKGKPGRKPKWDWKGALREMMRLANSVDGLPTPQSAIEERIMNWFLETCGECPSESAIRKFVSENLPPDYHQDD